MKWILGRISEVSFGHVDFKMPIRYQSGNCEEADQMHKFGVWRKVWCGDIL